MPLWRTIWKHSLTPVHIKANNAASTTLGVLSSIMRSPSRVVGQRSEAACIWHRSQKRRTSTLKRSAPNLESTLLEASFWMPVSKHASFARRFGCQMWKDAPNNADLKGLIHMINWGDDVLLTSYTCSVILNRTRQKCGNPITSVSERSSLTSSVACSIKRI